MLDLLTAGTLASLPLSIQTPLFARVRAAADRDRHDPSRLTCHVEPLTCCVEPDIRLRTWVTEALDDPTHAAAL